jgi:hypothetical protein
MTTPHYLVTTPTAADRALRKLTREGWTSREGFALPEKRWNVSPERLVLHGAVTDHPTAQLALLAAARGAAVVILTDPTSDLGQALQADLARIGPITPERSPLAPEQRALLDRLAAGETIAAAATAEYLSLRTANRRIAEARAALGVRTTREAVLAYLRLDRRT